jgi:hypothetical protein
MPKFSWYYPERRHLTWGETRRQGKWRFVVFNGVIRWGLPMFLVMACAPVYFGLPYRAEPAGYYWVWQSLLWIGAGFAYGLGVWLTSERCFLKHQPVSS